MMLEKLQNDLKTSLKAGESLKVSCLRYLLADIKNKQIEKKRPLTDVEIIALIQKQIKSRRESIALFKKGKRADLVEKEEAEIGILNEYLPKQLTEEEIRDIVKRVIVEVGAEGMRDMGKVMGQVMMQVKGKADGLLVSNIVKELLEV